MAYIQILDFVEWMRRKKGMSLINFAEEYRKEKKIKTTRKEKEKIEKIRKLKPEDIETKPDVTEADIEVYSPIDDGTDWFKKSFPDWRSMPLYNLKYLCSHHFGEVQNSPEFAEYVYAGLFYQRKIEEF